MRIGLTEIEDTFAEAFRMWFCRLVVTAEDEYWLWHGVQEATGYATSVIACDAEAGVESWLSPTQTPDGRPGAGVMFFGFSADQVAAAVRNRTGQCLMTCPTVAVYDGLPQAPERFRLGGHIRFFGDGFQKSKIIAGQRYWRVPVMEGEFLVQDQVGVAKGVGGGNFIVQAQDQATALAAVRRAVEVIAQVPGVITPFPGGVVRSGSKVGSRYKKLVASTNDAFCPTLAGRVPSQLHPQANCAYEIVIDGQDEQQVAQAMRAGIQAAAGPGVLRISAGNYGGKLGKFHFRLRELLQATSTPTPGAPSP